jgi:hypothetical protein
MVALVHDDVTHVGELGPAGRVRQGLHAADHDVGLDFVALSLDHADRPAIADDQAHLGLGLAGQFLRVDQDEDTASAPVRGPATVQQPPIRLSGERDGLAQAGGHDDRQPGLVRLLGPVAGRGRSGTAPDTSGA